MDIRSDVVERFLRYVKVDTQSKEGVEDRYPSTEKQLDLARMLVEEIAAQLKGIEGIETRSDQNTRPAAGN